MDQSTSIIGQTVGQGDGGGDAQPVVTAAAPSAPVPGVAQPAPAPSQPSGPPSVANQVIQQQAANPMGGVSPTPKPTSRLAAILGAVANVADTALSGIPSQGRPSFLTGAAQGARAEQANIANQNDLKFRQFSDQVRLAQLHNEDIRMQWADQDHQATVQANADAQAKRMTDTTGMTYTFVPNNDGGQEVLAHMTGQMAQNGHVSIPAGTIAGPKGWYVPNQGSAEQAQANTTDYNSRAAFYGLPAVAKGGVVNESAYDILRNMSNGYGPGGQILHATDLQSRVDNMKEQLAKYKATPNSDDNTIKAVQSDVDHLQNLATITAKRESDALDQAAQRKTDQQTQIVDEKADQQRQTNAEKPQKAQKPQNVDANGNPVWVPGVTADERKKAELSENVVFNANNIASILQRRPDIVGKVAGRFTTLDQMAGTNDPDITSLQQDMHNIAIANVGIHGMRANDAVHDVEKNILNNFKNGPLAIGGALKSTANSVQTFIDNARPDTYKTHSKNGGAIRSMVPQQGQQ